MTIQHNSSSEIDADPSTAQVKTRSSMLNSKGGQA